jgi:aquaporin Z
MKVLTEFIGSFLFMFAISLAAVSGSPIAALAIGGALLTMVYMGGHHSGAHYNPAVSTAFLIRKKLEAADFLPYVMAQILGSICAFGLGFYVTGKGVAIAPGEGVDTIKALVVEIVFTLMLALTVFNVATHKKVANNSFYGLAIGFVIVIAAISGGPLSGGAFNPAVGIGATLINALAAGGSWGNLWIYIVGPLVGGVLAAIIYGMQGDGSESA